MFNDNDSDPGTSNFVDGQIADLVLGQAGFVSNLPNQGGSATLSTMKFPVGIWVMFNPDDNALIVAVADTGNDRILFFFGPFGNGDAADFDQGVSGPVSATTMSGPTDIDLDGNFIMWVSDTGNNRVLKTNPGDPAAFGHCFCHRVFQHTFC